MPFGVWAPWSFGELIMKLALSAEIYSYLWINSFLKEDLYKNFEELYQNTIDI